MNVETRRAVNQLGMVAMSIGAGYATATGHYGLAVTLALMVLGNVEPFLVYIGRDSKP